MRKSIFDIASERTDMASDAKRIIDMATKEELLEAHYAEKTLFKFVDELCFAEWKHRGHFLNVNDYLSSLGFKEISASATQDVEALLTLVELVYNFWLLAYEKLDGNKGIYWAGNFFHLKDVMDDILTQYNQNIYRVDEEAVIVVEDKAEVTAVAELGPAEISFDVVRYNHRMLKGEIDAKKAILQKLGAKLEPKRKTLQGINKQLSEDIFFMLNNMNIRHNNRDKQDTSKYKEAVARMSSARLEKWYDELYQMILIAFLLLENAKRESKVKVLKDSIVGGNT